MKPYTKLSTVCNYSPDKVSTESLHRKSYVTTDNLKQNKTGKEDAVSLPTKTCNVTSYRPGDILVANIRPYLKKIWYSDTYGGASPDVLTIRTDIGYCSKYIYYNLFQDAFFEHMMRGWKGAKMPRGDKIQILDFPIPVRTLSDPKKIAKVLSTLDEKIELNNRINKELEAMAKLLYDYWFMQFDFPMTAEQATALGKPELEGQPYKSSGGKMIYNTKLKREIPEGWEADNILRLSALGGGGTPNKKISNYWDGNIPFFTPTDATPHTFLFETKNYITEEGHKKSSTRIYPKGTLFLTARGSVGKVMIAASEMAMSQSCYALVPDDDVSSQFMYFHSLTLIQYLKVKSNGSVFKSIVSNDIKSSPIILPNARTIKGFETITQPCFDQILNNQKQNQELTALRDWLLPMLMNGQVTVKD